MRDRDDATRKETERDEALLTISEALIHASQRGAQEDCGTVDAACEEQPDRKATLIGTLDQLLSRALMPACPRPFFFCSADR